MRSHGICVLILNRVRAVTIFQCGTNFPETVFMVCLSSVQNFFKRTITLLFFFVADSHKEINFYNLLHGLYKVVFTPGSLQGHMFNRPGLKKQKRI